jgi:hypothetical protein
MSREYPGETPDPRNPQMNRPGDVAGRTLGMMPNTPSKPGGDQNAGTQIGPGSKSWERGKAEALAHENISVAGKGAKPPKRR